MDLLISDPGNCDPGKCMWALICKGKTNKNACGSIR